MATKTVQVIVTRIYTKTAEILIQVDENATKKDISDFVANDTKTNNEIDEAIAAKSLNGGEDEYQYVEI